MQTNGGQGAHSFQLACVPEQLYRYFAVQSTALPALVTQLYSRIAEGYEEPWEQLTRHVVKVCNDFEKTKDDGAEVAKGAEADEGEEEENDEEDEEDE